MLFAVTRLEWNCFCAAVQSAPNSSSPSAGATCQNEYQQRHHRQPKTSSSSASSGSSSSCLQKRTTCKRQGKERANQRTLQQMIKVLWSSVISMKLNSAQLYQQSPSSYWKWMTPEGFVTLWRLIRIGHVHTASFRSDNRIYIIVPCVWNSTHSHICNHSNICRLAGVNQCLAIHYVPFFD